MERDWDRKGKVEIEIGIGRGRRRRYVKVTEVGSEKGVKAFLLRR